MDHTSPNKELHFVFAALDKVLDEHFKRSLISSDARGQNSGAWDGAMLDPILGVPFGIIIYLSQISSVEASLEGLGTLHDP